MSRSVTTAATASVTALTEADVYLEASTAVAAALAASTAE